MANENKPVKEPRYCPYCDAEIAEASFPYCEACAVDIFNCPNCNEPVPREQKICPHCGVDIREEVARGE